MTIISEVAESGRNLVQYQQIDIEQVKINLECNPAKLMFNKRPGTSSLARFNDAIPLSRLESKAATGLFQNTPAALEPLEYKQKLTSWSREWRRGESTLLAERRHEWSTEVKID